MTLTIDLIDSGALRLLRDLESLNLIQVKSPENTAAPPEPFPTIEELKAEAGRKAAERLAEMEKTGVDPLAQFAGCLKNIFPEDGMEYQRKMRDEWPD
ncbi:MAG: hypothetical protein LBK08_09720 [Treponema sp.]|jgi:hypothetical protein|nr:hypothetical protein [Treponema sp.]